MCDKGKKGKKKKIRPQKGSTQCRLLDDFRSGKQLDHDTRFAIYTNLINIHGGKRYFFKVTGRFYGEDTYQKWKKSTKYTGDYHPKRCSPEFCPYYGICEHEGTIVETLSMDRQVYLRKETYVSIDEAEACLRENLERALQSMDTGIHLIRAQTGLGKDKKSISGW